MVWKKGTKVIKESSRVSINAMYGAYGKQTFEMTIHSIQSSDYGTYSCTAKTVLGATSKSIELYGEYYLLLVELISNFNYIF